MKIALFGGSFNPVHNEHINIVKAAKRALGLDKVIIMPSCITPNKSGRLTASGKDRLEMCRLAFDGVEGVEVSDYELKRGGISYSYLTCRYLKQKFSDDELFFIVGSDMLENFAKWKNPEDILNNVTLAVCARENGERLKAAYKVFKSRFDSEPVIFDYIGAKLSSTRIRVLAALGGDFDVYVNKKEANYIKEHSIYALKEIQSVKKYLKPERWQHTLRVAVMAAENCFRIGVSEQTAITAAALHDCAKYLKPSSPELRGFVCPEGVPEPVVHQYAGAYVAERVFGVKDADILNAIKYHTSARENMSGLEKLLFLCDMLEEGRTFEGVDRLREIFNRNIDDCLNAALTHQVNYLKSTGEPIYPLTQSALNYLKAH